MAQSTRMLPRALSPRWLALRSRHGQWQTQRRSVATATAAVEDPAPVPFAPTPSRLDTIRQAKPFSDFLTDTYAREHDYLRISLTERCNLRCLYCMPEEGIQLSPNRELLTTAEIYYLSALFVNQGVTKIRLTGGEPTVRKDIVPLMHQIGSLRKNGLKELALTTNGISLHRKLDEMVKAGLTGVNISLDTLDPFQFQLLTRRAGFSAVMKSIDRVKEMNRLGAGIKLKINCVVMRGLNDHQVLPFVEMTQDDDIEVRFIEYMPFGGNKWSQNKMMSYSDMLDIIRTKYPGFGRLKDAKNDTSKTWQVPGFVGRVGFITSMTHNFCGTCNRLRITSDGNLKVCLHGEAEVSLRDLLRKDHGGDPLDEEAFEAIRQLELDHRRTRPEGEVGWLSKEQQLLDVIGAAVKRKEKGHAGMDQLQNMKNRPMILIDEPAKRHLARKSMSRKFTSPHVTPWSKVPLHLLDRPSFSSHQLRHYSDDKKSGLGFQSLSGLFSQAASRGRYSRPRERQVEPAKEKKTEEPPRDEKVDSRPFFATYSRSEGKEEQPTSPEARATVPAAETSERPNVSHKSESKPPLRYRDRIAALAAGTHNDPNAQFALRYIDKYPGGRKEVPARRLGRIRRTANNAVKRGFLLIKHSASPSVVGARTDAREQWMEKNRTPNPFSEQTPAPAEGTAEVVQPAKPAWGLSPEDQRTIDSITDPAGTTFMEARSEAEQTPSKKGAVFRPGHSIPSMSKAGQLTHVNASGEAHMVDVGAKASTHRVAIAITRVILSNPETTKMIRENSNKKGDVLGVARIAGIMAAKRTSDIIPLCHPLAISKAEVDISLEPPQKKQNIKNAVWIRTRVECYGPTGVEMEALAAATGAALTVYDMCKAVDRAMRIGSTTLVYKTGGRSGTYVDKLWRDVAGGAAYLKEHGLEDPSLTKKK